MEPSSSSVISRIYSSDWLSPTRLSDSPVRYDFPGDRFIPNRSLMDLDHAISLLTSKSLSPENPTFNEEYRRKINEVINSDSDGKPFRMLISRGRKRSERPRIRLIDEILPQDETDEKKNIKSPSRLPKIRSLEGHRQRVGCLAWRGQSVTSGSQDKSIINHDVRARSSLTSCIQGHTEEVCGLKWSSKGNQLASGGNDNIVCVWESSNMGLSRSMTRFTDHCAAVNALAWCRYQCDILASGGGSDDRCIKIWNSQTGKINEVMNSVSDGKQFIMLVFRGRKRSERPRIRLIDEILDQDETDEKNMNSLRRLPKSAYRVLDAPRLNDNFYMNLIDWGSNNVLVVGLVTQLYLWNSDGKPFRMLVFRGIKRTERPRIRLIDEILHQDETDEKKNIKSPSRLPKVRTQTPAQEGESPLNSLSSPLLHHSTSGDGSPNAAEFYSCSLSLAEHSGGNSSDPPRDDLPPTSPHGPPRQEDGPQSISDEIAFIVLSVSISLTFYMYINQLRPNSSMLYTLGSLMCGLISILVCVGLVWVFKAHPRAKHMARLLLSFSICCQFHLVLGYYSFVEVGSIDLIWKLVILASPTLIGFFMFFMFKQFL